MALVRLRRVAAGAVVIAAENEELHRREPPRACFADVYVAFDSVQLASPA